MSQRRARPHSSTSRVTSAPCSILLASAALSTAGSATRHAIRKEHGGANAIAVALTDAVGRGQACQKFAVGEAVPFLALPWVGHGQSSIAAARQASATPGARRPAEVKRHDPPPKQGDLPGAEGSHLQPHQGGEGARIASTRIAPPTASHNGAEGAQPCRSQPREGTSRGRGASRTTGSPCLQRATPG